MVDKAQKSFIYHDIPFIYLLLRYSSLINHASKSNVKPKLILCPVLWMYRQMSIKPYNFHEWACYITSLGECHLKRAFLKLLNQTTHEGFVAYWYVICSSRSKLNTFGILGWIIGLITNAPVFIKQRSILYDW